MKKKIIFSAIAIVWLLMTPKIIEAGAEPLAQYLAGRIVLQVQAKGEAWYINPADLKRYYLGRPADAFFLMRNFASGITDNDLFKIPIGLIDDNKTANDNDGDGLDDNLETAIGTNADNPDSDNDGYSDRTELINNYNPLGEGKLILNADLAEKNSGKIFLQIQKQGQAWYVNPTDKKRYFLGQPDDAFIIMKKLGLGISDKNIAEIKIAYFYLSSNQPEPDGQNIQPTDNLNDAAESDIIMKNASAAISRGDSLEATKYFIPQLKKIIEYSISFLNADGRSSFADLLNGMKMSASSSEEKKYSSVIYFSGYKTDYNLTLRRQPNGSWLIANL